MLRLLLPLMVITVIIYQFHFFWDRSHPQKRSWEQITSELTPVNCDLLIDLANQMKRDVWCDDASNLLYIAVGGWSGVRALEHNARLMLELAVYAERWNDVNGALFSETMRYEALLLKEAVLRMRVSRSFHKDLIGRADCLAQVLASYVTMRSGLVSMYANVHEGRLRDLVCSI